MSEPSRIQGAITSVDRTQLDRANKEYEYGGIVIIDGRRRRLTKALADEKINDFISKGATEFITPDGYQLHDNIRKRIEDSGVDYDLKIDIGRNNSLVYKFKRA